MNKKLLSLFFCAVTILMSFQAKAQCNTATSICTPGTAGPFNFVTPGPAVSTCLDWIGPSTGYIILHITTPGPLNMLIDGNATAGYLDVAVFNIPAGQAPCTAIQNTANQIGCNYASAASGCNQFGTAFACGSSVPAPMVSAGQDLMIVVENWSGSSSDFTLTLGPSPGAQTGPPNSTINSAGPFCSTGAAVQLLAADNGGTWSGPGTSASGMFNPSTAGVGTHTINYSIGVAPCNSASTTTITVNPPTPLSISPSPSPPNICSGQSVTLTASGSASYSWSPGGATTAAITVSPTSTTTYTVTSPGCASSATQTVNVTPSANPAWSQPPAMCVSDAAINLNTFITGTSGGTWSGTGVSGNMFDPAGLSGPIAVTYTVGTAPCDGTSTLNISVSPNTPPTITSSPAAQCSNAAAFNLTADFAGGTWSGTGITDGTAGTFDPSAAATGNNQIVYSMPGSCSGSDTIQINVIAAPDPAWSAALLCANNAPISLDSLITGTSGGTWSGSGVSGNMFDPTGLSGAIPVTYTVGSACVASSVQNITVVPNADPAWTTTSICQISSAINLDTLVTGTSGGTWSGTGVSGSNFNPSGLSGNIAVTYTVGTAPCQSMSTQNIFVVPLSDATWTTTSLCSNDSTINLDSTVTGTSGGTWSGTGVTGNSFDPSGLSGGISVTYTVGPVGCQASSSQNITVTPAGDASWTATSVCTSAAPIDLNTLITGTSGGTWSGTGVSGNMFDPTGLSGNIAVTYIAGTASCPDTLTQNISVVPTTNASWTSTSLCSSDTAINLDSLVTGTAGGTWSGTGVTGSNFDPSGLSGAIAVTYNVGPVGCSSTSTQNITVTPSADPSWTTTTLCATATPINLNSSVTGTPGGTWSGTGVTGSTFDPAGLSGSIAVTYTVGTAPCTSTSVQNITVVPVASASWTTTSLCENATPINLNASVTGTSGGTWSGTGVTGSTFDPSGLSGSIAVTYTVGTSPCTSTSTQNITVTPNANATINSVTPMCQTASPITLTAASTGGTWSGTGITNTSTGAFSPSVATPGTYVITYSIPGACGDTDTVSVTVLPNPSAAWAIPASICENANPVDLSTLVTGASGGTFSGIGVSGTVFDPAGLSGNNTINYTVTVNGCTSSSSQVVNVDPITAAFSATPLSGLSPVSVTTFNNCSNAVSYLWNFGNGATSTAINPSTVYTGMGNYTIILTATNGSGCIDTAMLLVHVDEISALMIPNVFTPNGDLNNDTFHPIVAEGLSEFNAVVYDRWGLKLHEWNDEKQGWDGKTKNGKPAPDGTYYYMISGKGVDGKVYDYTGYVQLFNN